MHPMKTIQKISCPAPDSIAHFFFTTFHINRFRSTVEPLLALRINEAREVIQPQFFTSLNVVQWCFPLCPLQLNKIRNLRLTFSI